MVTKHTITYRCGHQHRDFIYAREDFIAGKMAEFSRHLCLPSQMRKEQQQFEAVLAALQTAGQTIYNILYHNGYLAAVTPTRPGYCLLIVCSNGEAPFYHQEVEISQVTAELHERGFKSLYWGGKKPAELEGCIS